MSKSEIITPYQHDAVSVENHFNSKSTIHNAMEKKNKTVTPMM